MIFSTKKSFGSLIALLKRKMLLFPFLCNTLT